MPKCPCLDCGTLTPATRCLDCQRNKARAYEQSRGPKPPTHQQTYDWRWRKFSKQLRQQFIDSGAGTLPPCPGWGVPPHPTTVDQLTVDHDLLAVICRSCNSRKAQQHDKPRRQAQGGTPTA